MTMRKMIKERKVYSLYDFDGKLCEVRDFIDSLIDEFGANAMLDNDTEWDYDGDRSIFVLHYEREETDAEMNKRLEAARKQREYRKVQKAKEAVEREARERKELARLLEKYGEE